MEILWFHVNENLHALIGDGRAEPVAKFDSRDVNMNQVCIESGTLVALNDA